MKTRGLWFRSIFSLAAVASCCWTTFSWATKVGEKSSFQPIEDERSFAELFEPSEEIAVIGSSQFPKPTRKIDDNATIIIEPTLGKHRPDEDAILAYAEGYHLSNYMMFMESLQSTGYTGDVVFSIAEERIIREHVMDYLTGFTKGDKNKPNLVIYQVPLDCDGEEGNKRRISRTGDTDGFQMCRLSNIYGWKDAEGNVIGTAPDPRKGRVVATLRYEWYWIWSLMYNPHSWLMLIDARDSFFQTNPFIGLPRETDPNRPDGLLYLFGENPEATRLGISKKNKQWISNAYGAAAIEALKDKPTICSGSTMGEQIAIETYLRAMVNEHDECSIKMMGSDQGFHNVSCSSVIFMQTIAPKASNYSDNCSTVFIL